MVIADTDLLPVYNIVMDFVFALFPWCITYRLNLKRAEKIALCVTLSLGMVSVLQQKANRRREAVLY